MKKYVIRDREYSNLLISLPRLMERLSFVDVHFWAFRNMEIRYSFPFGIVLNEFERMTRDLDFGFVVSDSDFRRFLRNPDFEIIDGLIDGYRSKDVSAPLLTIDCFDSTQWEITTGSDTLAGKLEASGLTPEILDVNDFRTTTHTAPNWSIEKSGTYYRLILRILQSGRRSSGGMLGPSSPVRPPARPVPLRRRGSPRLKRELKGAMRVAPKVAQPRHENQLCPHVPGRPSLEETLPVRSGHRFHLLQVHLDAGGERRLDFFKGIAKSRDVEGDADRLPYGAGPIGVTAQRRVSDHIHEFRLY